MAKPTPILRRGRWTLDLRWAGLGQYTLRTPGLPDLAIDATQESYDVFARERQAAEANAVQGSIFAGPSFGKIAKDLVEEREHDTLGGQRYVLGYVKKVREHFGARAVRQFSGQAGSKILRDWRDDMKAAGLSPKTRRNYLNVCMQVLQHAADRGLLEALPVKPKSTCIGETLTSPDYPWYSEADFRALRDGLYGDHGPELRAHVPDRDVESYIARRKLYLSFAFYAGLHVADLDRLSDDHVSPDFGSYTRTNTKSAKSVQPAPFDCPEALWLDIKAELARLGRPWKFGELICGGPWTTGSAVLHKTATRLGLPLPINFRSVLRRSTAYEYALRGWSEREVADILGHVDERMVRQVYRRVPLRLRSPVKIPWDRESTARLLGGVPWTSRAKVAPIRPTAVAFTVQRKKA